MIDRRTAHPAVVRIGMAMLLLVAWSARAHADPFLAYASYLGGTGDESDVFGSGVVDVAVDPLGNMYVAGTTRSADFPGHAGDPTVGDLDIFVTKFSPAGEPVYSRRFGGPCDDVVRDLAIDSAGEAYVAGRINGGLCLEDVEPSALVLKLGPDGSSLFWAYFGGTVGDESIATGIAVDATGAVHVTGIARSASRDFPATPDAFGTEECGGAGGDVFVAKLNKLGNLFLYSGLLCGTGDDQPGGIAIDGEGYAYVAGTTSSGDLPVVNPLQGASQAGVTGFVAKVSPLGQQLMWFTYLGGSEYDLIRDVAIDAQRNVYVTGETQSVDFPTTPGVLQERAGDRDCPWGLCSDAFVTKIDASGAALAYSTYLFGESDDGGADIAVDAGGNAVVAGTTGSIFFPLRDALQWKVYGMTDAFVAKLAPDGTRLVYSTFYGGADSGTSPYFGYDLGTSIALDGAGDAYFAGYTWSYDLQTTNDGFQRDLAPGVCDDEGTPCGDAFFGKIVGGGPSSEPPLHVAVTPEDVRPGDTVTATWAALPAPSLGDRLQLHALGAWGYEAGDATAWWPTRGEAAGDEPLALPEDLEPGTYEVRVVSTDPRYGEMAVMARSEPFRVAVTGTQPCEILGPGLCDDGEACTDDVCVAGMGCLSTPAVSIASVTCTCARSRPAACGSQFVPSAFARRKDRACGIVAGGSSGRHLRAAMKKLKGAMHAVARSRKKGKISSECAGALAADLYDAKGRVERLFGEYGR